ncbi:MAG: hypothetical protein K1X63_00720 [Chitinophagales bacterium]|nr:hypothetical protein [Chitinophagales bacterium]
MSKSPGRPPTRQARLMDGFYIEVRNKGSKEKGVKIRSTSKSAMDDLAKQYQRSNKDVIILGEYKDEKWISNS